MKNVVIIGAGGHAKVITDIIQKSGDCVKGYLDSIRNSGEFLGHPILGSNADYKKFLDCYFIIAVGGNNERRRIAESMPEAKWHTAVHPSACISSIDVKIGEGTVISANAVINSCTQIGKHCIINSGAVIEHDNTLEDYVHAASRTCTAGRVSIGRCTLLGTGAIAGTNVSICENCIIGAGALVIKSIDKPGVYAGVPAKFLHE